MSDERAARRHGARRARGANVATAAAAAARATSARATATSARATATSAMGAPATTTATGTTGAPAAETGRRRHVQLLLEEARRPGGRGGWRPGAGRKPSGGRVEPRHRRRPELSRHHPVHVVLRVAPEVGRLRRPKVYRALRGAVAHMLGRGDFRIVHVSLQHNHVHLLVEATDRRALARGVQAFEISAARRLNRALGRRTGRVFVHRYHSTVLTTPRQARHCLAYVLNNWRRHREDLRTPAARRAAIDPYSSAIHFDGWRGVAGTFPVPAGYEPLPTAPATVWLLTTGWRRHGPIDPREVPGPPP